MYQDGYPLLIASEESLVSLQERMRGEVGKQGVSDRWSEDQLVMERYRDSLSAQIILTWVTMLLRVWLKVQAEHRDARRWYPVG